MYEAFKEKMFAKPEKIGDFETHEEAWEALLKEQVDPKNSEYSGFFVKGPVDG